MSLWRIFATVAGVALAARAAHLAIIWNHPLWVLGEFWSKSDMQQFIAWGNHLASGDWLDRETFRPYFDWQRSIAPPEVWNSWFGAHVYYQPPLYAYLLASVLAVTGSLDLFRVGQLVLGAVNCGLIAVLGTRLFNRTAGWVAGLAAACYAPFIFTDAEILRGTLTLATQLLVLLAMVSWHRAEPPGERRLWLVLIGGAFGVAYLADPAMVVFIPFALGWLLVAQRARGKAPAGPARLLARPALVMAGAMAALAPLVARNLAVGAPPLSCTTRGPLAFVMGNAPDAMPAGATIPASTGRILRRSGYAMLPTIRETLRLYAGHYGPLLRQQWFKLRALWSAYEIPDNTSFYYAARVSPVVRYGLRFSVVASLGLIGLVLALPGVLADPRRLLPVLYLLSSEVLFVLAHVVSRYRRPMVLALLLFAGYAVAWLAGRRWQA
ncbi:MAG: glycosyltransferase family 39 protein, partial [Acidobacteriota bacterium]